MRHHRQPKHKGCEITDNLKARQKSSKFKGFPVLTFIMALLYLTKCYFWNGSTSQWTIEISDLWKDIMKRERSTHNYKIVPSRSTSQDWRIKILRTWHIQCNYYDLYRVYIVHTCQFYAVLNVISPAIILLRTLILIFKGVIMFQNKRCVSYIF